jgi:orotidine-5'-phosphate decarboxylase
MIEASNLSSTPSTNSTHKTYLERLLSRTRLLGHATCVGMDPVAKKIPGEGTIAVRIERFYVQMLEAMDKAGVHPAAVKPNIAYFEAHGLDCLRVLMRLVTECQERGILVILDAKRGDIGTTSEAYARAAFEVYGADAVTVAPYMGWDTVRPFIEVSQAQGIYVLVRTSNPSARDFQELWVQEGDKAPERLYRRVAAKLTEWNNGNIGAVVGATAPSELTELLAFWKGHGHDIPLLVPGIAVKGVSGGQGGDAHGVVHAIRKAGSNPLMHLITSSSGINYAYEKFPKLSAAEASVQALKDLIAELREAMV